MPEQMQTTPAFLQDGGEIGALIRAHDWSRSPLGAPDDWPQSLRSVVGLMLTSRFPMFVAWGDELGFLYNKPYAEILGAKHPKAMGERFHDIWREIWPDISPLINAALAGETTFRENLPLIMNRSGFDEQTWFTFSYSPVRNESGRVAGMFCTCTEITAQVLADKQLSTERERQRLMLKEMPGFAALLVGPEHRYEYVNDAYVEIAGLRDYIGRTVREVLPELEGQGNYELLDQVYETGEPFVARGRPIRLHGDKEQERYIDFVYEPVRDDSGAVTGIFVGGYDVTATKRAESALREMNDSLEQRVAEATADLDRVWRNANDMFLVISGEGIIQSMNPAATAILGWSELEMVGQSVFDFILPDDTPGSVSALEHTRQSPLANFENRYRTKDGGLRTISWLAAPEADMIYAYGRDVSAERKHQSELETAQEALRQAQKMEAVGQLTGGLAHDFNNLLGGISGSLDLMSSRLKQGRFGDLDRHISAARDAATRAASLTHRLLAFSRRQTLDPRITDVNRLIDGMAELVRRTVGPSISVEINEGSDLWATLVDSSQLENALLNLSINARDAMPDGGRIFIETVNESFDAQTAREHDMTPGQYLSLRVTDTGTGMAPEVKARAFDPFFTTKPIGEGTGLGLSMVYGFAKQSGGQLRIRSEIGQGTTICLYLPRHAGETDNSEESGNNAPIAPPAIAGSVLLVEDESIIRMVVAETLEDLGHTVIQAKDGAAGFEVLKSDVPIDLLVTDVGLPRGMNGRQLADAARELRPNLKVLFITGYAEESLLKDGQLAPGMQVLTKPFSTDSMAKRVEEMTRSE